jgi:hypothetical protein
LCLKFLAYYDAPIAFFRFSWHSFWLFLKAFPMAFDCIIKAFLRPWGLVEPIIAPFRISQNL